MSDTRIQTVLTRQRRSLIVDRLFLVGVACMTMVNLLAVV